ncbi:hypothetical protein CRE_18231 [Caenorhabditis remanei]|uniref:Uncharacterized protein n=1 Tax=Caenorhabditis remanei TaxID=31234 RepID=E3NFH3_CAERE|nr:hypothetical protein CRE_18231 [Caenorhabditis remanei]
MDLQRRRQEIRRLVEKNRATSKAATTFATHTCPKLSNACVQKTKSKKVCLMNQEVTVIAKTVQHPHDNADALDILHC